MGLSGQALGGQAREGELVSLSRRAMGSRFEIMLPPGDNQAVAAAQEALALVADLERQMTVFRDDSEVSHINRRAAREPVEVEAGLFGLLQTAERLARETGGAFDVTAGPLTCLWSACRREQRLPGADEVEQARRCVGMQHVRLDSERRTVAFARAGVKINLGAIGKGYALDRVREALQGRGVTAALVHGGHSSICALGRPPWEDAWTVSVRHPRGGERPLARLRLREQGMGTSGSAEQFFEAAGKRYGHVIDPRSGWPAEGLLSATCTAPTAAEADALSTAFFTMGVEATRDYCAKHPGVAALLAVGGAGENVVEVVNAGIPDDSLEAPV